ncbi:hypothetical protein Glove_429g38 [Diversispora epigaea]|uniref:Glucosamine 6-phosphate N-acetyltransferase n=1 Tax=Diversispora epigaea TaxID=1348612 RepID=A0A397GXL3_9GLOM|nr:hypothetical protein Glove_429g38 [Diversispora epigaea]
MSNYLFDESLISPLIQTELPPIYKLRPLATEDYDKGVLDCLKQLSIVGNVSKENFVERFESMKSASRYYIVVIENEKDKKVVAVGTLLVELKFLRNCGKAGHIEDIVVHDSQRGMNLGRRIIEQLKYLGQKLGCYKIILNCNQNNITFYEKCGLTVKDVQMTLYYEAEN